MDYGLKFVATPTLRWLSSYTCEKGVSPYRLLPCDAPFNAMSGPFELNDYSIIRLSGLRAFRF